MTYLNELRELYDNYRGKELEVALGISQRSIQNYLNQERTPKQDVKDKIRETFANHKQGKPLIKQDGEIKGDDYSAKSIFNLTESNRQLTETNQQMLLMMKEALEHVRSNLNSIPDSMTLLTDLIVKNQEHSTERLLKELRALSSRRSTGERVGDNKTLQNRKH